MDNQQKVAILEEIANNLRMSGAELEELCYHADGRDEHFLRYAGERKSTLARVVQVMIREAGGPYSFAYQEPQRVALLARRAIYSSDASLRDKLTCYIEGQKSVQSLIDQLKLQEGFEKSTFDAIRHLELETSRGLSDLVIRLAVA